MANTVNGRTKGGKFKPGDPKPPNSGRQKGTKNKYPADIRKIYEEVFYKIGGVEAFATWAKKTDHNRGVYYSMVSKLLPRTIEGKLGGDITVIVKTAIPRPPKKAQGKGRGKPGEKT